MLRIRVAGADVVLHPSGAALLSESKTLLVADAHFGKAVSFRKLGVPVPEATTGGTLDALSAAIDATQARRVVFLGDFLHSRRSHAPETLSALARWRAERAGLELTLVRGNHDDRAGDPPASLAIEVVDEPHRIGPFACCHHPQTHPTHFVLAGHVHPACRLHGTGRDRLRLPCFVHEAGHAILPAFGEFTGGWQVPPAPGRRFYGVGGESVWALPPDSTPAQRRA